MRLIKCYIENFGKLSGYEHSFNDDLTVIFEENGFGKTTLAVFIKSMLYGMPETKSTDISLNDRFKYMPWQGGRFGGYLVFEANINGEKRQIRIDRCFGKKASADEYSITDAKTGEKLSGFSSKIGEELFGIDADAFSKSVYLPQERRTEKRSSTQKGQKPGNTSITTKLSNLLEQSDDIGSYDIAIKELDKKRLYYCTNKGGGEINKLTEKINAKKAELDEAEAASRACDVLEKEIRALESTIGEKESEKDQLQDKISPLDERISKEKTELAAKIKAKGPILDQLKTLDSKRIELDNSLANQLSFFSCKMPDDGIANELLSVASEISETSQKYNVAGLSESDSVRYDSLNQKFSAPLPENIKSYIASAEDQSDRDDLHLLPELLLEENRLAEKTSGKNGGAIILLPLAILALICGAVLPGISAVIRAVIIAAGVIFAAVCAVMLVKSKGGGRAEKITAILKHFYPEYSPEQKSQSHTTKILTLRDEIQEYDRLSRIKAEQDKNIAALKKRLSELRAEFEKCLTELGVKLSSIESLAKRQGYGSVAKGGYDFYAIANEIAESIKDLKSTKSALDEATNDLIEYKKKNAIYLSEGENDKGDIEKRDLELNALKAARRSLENDIAKEKEALIKAKAKRDGLSDKAASTSDLLNELNAYKNDLDIMRKKHTAIEKTIEYLGEAKKRLSSRYLDPMRNDFCKLISYVCSSCNDAEPKGGENQNAETLLQSNEQSDAFKAELGKLSTSDEWMIDPELNITQSGKTGVHGYGSFSSGYKDIIDICLHLALSDTLFKDEKPFIILDDPFINLDEEKLNNALEILKRISGERQIIYLVCHKSRLPRK